MSSKAISKRAPSSPVAVASPSQSEAASERSASLTARIVTILGGINEEGLGLTELRTLLGERAETVREALATLVRKGRVRRLGASSKTRYVLNRHSE